MAQEKGQASSRHNKVIVSSLHSSTAVWVNSVTLLQEKQRLPPLLLSPHCWPAHRTLWAFAPAQTLSADDQLGLHSVRFWALGFHDPSHAFAASGSHVCHLLSSSLHIFFLTPVPWGVFLCSLPQFQGAGPDLRLTPKQWRKMQKEVLKESLKATCQLTKCRFLGPSYIETAYLELSQT